MGSIFYGEGFPPPLAMKNVSIKHLQLFEDRSDAACRVVIKTIHFALVVAVGGGIFAKTAKTRKRRGTPRRYVLRGTGE